MITGLTSQDIVRLRFPGDVPGVLRRGSPVHTAGWGPGVCLSVAITGAKPFAWVAPDAEPEECSVVTPDLSDVTLDLTDATGRAHLTWWLAVSSACCRESDVALFPPVWGPREPRMTGEPIPGWDLHHREGTLFHRWFIREGDPLIAGLDPNDPRLLSDGSRYIDALALLLLALKIAKRGEVE